MGTSEVKTSTKTFNISQTSYKESDDKWTPVGTDTPLPISGKVNLTNSDGNIINPATEDTVSQLVMSVDNAINEKAYNLNAAIFSETTNISNDYELDNVEFNFSTAESKTIMVKSADGTILLNETSNTDTSFVWQPSSEMSFSGGENLTVSVTQFSSAGTMDCVLKIKQGNSTLSGNPVLGSGTNLFGIPYNFNLEVAKGRVSSHRCVWSLGERESVQVTNTGEDIWRGDTTTIPIPDQTTGEQMTIVSTSTSDASTGLGVLTVLIHYLDINWIEQTETIILDGTIEVDTIATDIKFIQDFHATTVGSNGVAAGNITLYKKGDPSITYDMLALGGNMSLTISKMVPSGKTFYLTRWQTSSTAGKPIFVRIRSTDHHGVLYSGGSPTFLFKDTASVQDSTYIKDFECPIEIPAKSIIKVSAWGTTGNPGGNISASYEGLLVG